jgi:hypothetical protein
MVAVTGGTDTNIQNPSILCQAARFKTMNLCAVFNEVGNHGHGSHPLRIWNEGDLFPLHFLKSPTESLRKRGADILNLAFKIIDNNGIGGGIPEGAV